MYTSKGVKYKIKQKDIAQWFGYSSQYTFNSSSAKDRIMNGVKQLIQHIEDEVIRRVKG